MTITIPTTTTHANDNAIPDIPALRREYLRTRASQPDPAPVLACPTLERLKRNDAEAAQALFHWRDLTTPQPPVAANDNDPAVAEFALDAHIEVRPSIEELQRAWEGHELERVDGQTRLGCLVFSSGKLVQYGRTARGKPLRPREDVRRPKGSRLPVDDTGGRLAGLCRSSGLARQGDVGEYAAEAEFVRRDLERRFRSVLGAHADVLDEACTDATARQIGEARGFDGKTAERHGIRLIDQAIAAFREAKENDQQQAA